MSYLNSGSGGSISGRWEARAKQLESQENDLKRSLPEHLKEILKSKRLLL